MLEKFLIEILEEYEENCGNAGCNDWYTPYDNDLWELISFIFQYGVDHNLWDDGCKPQHDYEKIWWYNFCISAYFKHALKNNNLKLS